MNIFFLHHESQKCAEMHCDKHVPKLIVEIAQMMASALRRHGVSDEWFEDNDVMTLAGTPYKGGYHNHPMTRWVGDTQGNFEYAGDLGVFLCWEYSLRYKWNDGTSKEHACAENIETMLYHGYDFIPKGEWTNPPQCMPDEYKHESVITAYRNYYMGEKAYFAKWEKGREAPAWFVARQTLYRGDKQDGLRNESDSASVDMGILGSGNLANTTAKHDVVFRRHSRGGLNG